MHSIGCTHGTVFKEWNLCLYGAHCVSMEHLCCINYMKKRGAVDYVLLTVPSSVFYLHRFLDSFLVNDGKATKQRSWPKGEVQESLRTWEFQI